MDSDPDDLCGVALALGVGILLNAILPEPKKKRKKRIWIRPFIRERESHGAHAVLMLMLREDDTHVYQNFLRVPERLFLVLLRITTLYLLEQTTRWRAPLSPSERLTITLRFLATGDSYKSLGYLFYVGASTVGKVVSETCQVIYDKIGALYLKPDHLTRTPIGVRRDNINPRVATPLGIKSQHDEWKSPTETFDAARGDEVEEVQEEEEAKQDVPFKDLTCHQKTLYVLVAAGRPAAILTCLYFFICSLNLLGSGFLLIGGRLAGDALGRNPLLSNPICGLMIGVTSTAFLQSSSTSTSIVVTMVASGIMPVQLAIPIIMGSNIGTSVTGIIVATTQAGDREMFRKAFAAATVHDMFNWLTVFTLLPVEITTGYLYHVTSAMVGTTSSSGGTEGIEFISAITKPFVNLIVQVDKDALDKISKKEPGYEELSLLKYWCETKSVPVNSTEIPVISYEGAYNLMASRTTISTPSPIKIVGVKPCAYMFHGTSLSEHAVGGLVVLIALVMLVTCLILMVKVLKSLLAGPMAKVVQKTINADFPGRAACLTGYVAIFVGAIATILVQSSSVVASALTPLVGLGLVTVERVFPMLLGANIGTTSTAILAAFAASGIKFKATFQIALCHLFFNLTGIIIWYPLPFMRKVPISMAKFLGRTTSHYRWFAIMYIICMFFLFPLSIFALSIPGWQVLVGVGMPLIILLIFVGVITFLQKKHPQWLPKVLQTWEFLPECMRSLAPLDRQVVKLIKCCSCSKCCQNLSQEEATNREDTPDTGVIDSNIDVRENMAFDTTKDSGSGFDITKDSRDSGIYVSSASKFALAMPAYYEYSV